MVALIIYPRLDVWQPSLSPCVSGHAAASPRPCLRPQGLEAHTKHTDTHTHTHSYTHAHGATRTSLHQRYICSLCMFDGTGRQRLATAPCRGGRKAVSAGEGKEGAFPRNT